MSDASLAEQPPPPDSWPGAGGRRSVAPPVNAPGATSGGGPGGSWPGAVPRAAAPEAPTPEARLEELRLRPPANRVSRSAVGMWTLGAVVAWLVPLVAVCVWVVADADHRSWQAPIAVCLAVAAVAHVLVMPRWRYRVHRWEVTPQAVYTQSGWFRQDRRLAAISRVQTVDSKRGPLEQMFGLGTVTVTTASAAGPLEISGLRAGVVAQLVADLSRATARDRGDAT